MFTFFTTNEANDALPDVIKKFEYALAKNTEVKKIEQELQMSISTTNSFTGVVVKSIEQGLLDFPSKRFDEEVWLCWKYGETEIKFWHEKDSGFMGRKPIEVNDDSLV
jgi:hypothetical protein